MTWRLIDESETNIFRSLAVEEALARVNAEREKKINTIRFWRSPPAVVLGRFQCAHKEANFDFCDENHIPIARRFTGGGTVYHDLGNLNFSLCMDQSCCFVPRTLPELYWNFIGGIASGLQEIGIPVNFDAHRSCLRIGGKKITGTAGWIKRGVSFIHGTLLIDADLERLSWSLSAPPGQTVYLRDPKNTRCMESKRDVVTTISCELGEAPPLPEIKDVIIRALERISESEVRPGRLTDREREVAEILYRERYSRPEWNLGYPVSHEIATKQMEITQ
ncbi:MAG: hypothetical protein DRO93_11705 [Candidatus Thorarchaeota archaeon]|nr:MAG: hypothetical protein DRO93_11705 [Candidatus Thorarchaeota archaeon]